MTTTKSKKIGHYILAFLLPFIILIVVWMILGLAPFGQNNLMVSDLGTQYVPFLNAFKRFFMDGGQSLYSFENGIGGPMESTIAYYLMSPFNFLVLPFSYENIPEAVLLIITLKIALMGLTMYTYLDRHYKQSDIVTLAFSLAYSFCGFVVVYLLNFMWLDVLVLLPLLVLGIEKVWHEKKYGLYGSMLFLSILTNYYLGYMVCIFSVLYSFYIYYLTYENRQAGSVLVFLKRWQGFIVTSLLSGLLTSFMLIPAILGMFQTGKSDFHLSDFLPTPQFGLEIFSQMGLGTINFSIRLYHLPMIYAGVFIYLLCFLYFSLPIVRKRKKKAMAVFLLVMYLSFLFNLPNTIWHMFQSPAGFPYRNSFLLSFLLIKVGYETYLYARLTFDKSVIKKRLIWSASIFCVLLCVGQFFLVTFSDKTYVLSNHYFVLSLIVVWVMALLIQLILTKKNNWLSFVFVICIVLELGGNLWISMKDIPFGNQTDYASSYKEQEKVIKSLTDNEDALTRINYRVDAKKMGYQEINNGYNNGFLFGYSGVSSYSSTLNSDVQSSLEDLGLYAKNERRISYVSDSQVVNLLLNIKYQVTPKTVSSKEIKQKEDDKNVYLNDEAIGGGFLINRNILDVTLDSLDVIANQEAILQSLHSLPQEDYFMKTTDVTIQNNGNQCLITGTTTTNGYNYLYIPHAHFKHVDSIKVNGQLLKTDMYIASNQLFNLGYFEKGQEITVQLNLTSAFDTDGLSWASLDQTTFDDLIDYQKNRAITLNKTTFGGMETSIKVYDQNQLLYLSIPYDSNWQIKANGKTIKTKQVVGNFIGLELEPGEYKITLHYQSKPLITGVSMSLITLVITLILSLIRYKKRKIIRRNRNADKRR